VAGPDGQILLLATAKGSHVVMAYDGETGALVGRMGRQGSGPGEFLRPNGIFVHDDHVFIVERDNRRVQVLTLPDFQSVATFGDDVLLKPYGISGFESDDGVLHLWITDDFDVTGEAPATWENRVKRFAVDVAGSGAQATVSATLKGTVGDAEGSGRLVVVESILADPAHDRLLIADEDESQRTIKVFRLDGTFTGRQLGGDVFSAEPEGIALWGCEAGGYLLMADQSYDMNQFHVFDRESLEHLGTFAGEAVANTDGVAVLNGPAGRLGEGAFYAIHADQGAVGFAWSDVAAALGLRPTC
jgi:3-phytase